MSRTINNEHTVLGRFFAYDFLNAAPLITAAPSYPCPTTLFRFMCHNLNKLQNDFAKVNLQKCDIITV